VSLLPAPADPRNEDLDGILLILEEGTGRVRAIGPVLARGGLWPLLSRALLEPAPPTVPARPRALLVDDPSLSERLRQVAPEIPVSVVAELPAVKKALHVLLPQLEPLDDHDLKTNLERWAPALTELCRIAPWTLLPDSHVFHFRGEVPELAEAVAVVIGLAGQQEGVVVYPSREAYERFVALAASGLGKQAMSEVTATCLYVESGTDAETRAAAARGLALPGGRFPSAVVAQGSRVRAPSAREEQVLLAAVEAIVAVCGRTTQYDQRPADTEVQTLLGPLVVFSEPPAHVDTPMANAFSHTVILTTVAHPHEEREPELGLAVIVKLAKRDALELAQELAAAESLQVERRRQGGVRLRLWADPQHLGAFCDLPVDGPLSEELLQARTVTLAVSAGGSKRRSLNPADVVMSVRLANRPPERRTMRHDPVFDQPSATWPKVSDTLMRYTEGALGPADFTSDTSFLDQLHMAPLPPHLVSALIRQKRQQFPGDPRVIHGVQLQWRGGEPRFMATCSFPRGYSPNTPPH
jgi:hypothetical protein